LTFVILAYFRIPAADFLLDEALDAVGSLEVELDTAVVHNASTTPPFWLSADDWQRAERALHADASLGPVEVVGRSERGRLYVADWWRDLADRLLKAIRAVNGALVAATAGSRE
jgi:hypothetical protein